MAQWFECKIKYDKNMGDATIKTVSENFLVDALSFTEAEARITEEMTPYISGDFKVDTVKRVKMSEIFFDENGDKWYKAKVNFITIDEKKATEKRVATYMYVQASDFTKALQNLTEELKGSMEDLEIASIAETNILDVFREDLSGAKE